MRLIKYNDNWADEMDLHGVGIMADENWDRVKKKIENYTYPLEAGVGTNQSVKFSCGKHYLNHLKVEEISPLEARTIEKYIGRRYGFFDVLDQICATIHEESKSEF